VAQARVQANRSCNTGLLKWSRRKNGWQLQIRFADQSNTPLRYFFIATLERSEFSLRTSFLTPTGGRRGKLGEQEGAAKFVVISALRLYAMPCSCRGFEQRSGLWIDDWMADG
jgi:hypothetical protein